MAMSRSLGALSLTTLPPIRSSPSVMSSRPAIMLSVVDLPQPDGPTRITNSPSAISRLTSLTASAPSGKRLVMWFRTISATGLSFGPLALDRAGCQPRDDPALEEQHEDDDGNGDDHRCRGDRPGRHGELRVPGEERHCGRRGAGRGRRGQRDREQELVPAEQEHQDRGGDHAGRGERGDDPHERLERRGTVHLGGLLQFPGDLAEERRQRVDAERQAGGHIRDDQPGPGVEQAEDPLDVEQRSEEHTSELQSQSNLVCRLLLEKKKKKKFEYSSGVKSEILSFALSVESVKGDERATPQHSLFFF